MKTAFAVIGFAIIGGAAFYWWPADPCLDLDACAQYNCLDPKFYCAETLYESAAAPTDISDAEQIVMDYVKQMGQTATIVSAARTRESYHWYQVTCRLSDGTEQGYEVGPDGNIYEIKHYN